MRERVDLQAPKLAVITGASSGIGFELAKVFGKNDYDLVIVAENTEIFNAKEQLEAIGVDVIAYQINLADFQGVELFFEKINSLARPLDAVAINAGVGVGGDFAEDTDLMAELNVINLNVTSSVHLTKRVVNKMLSDSQGGRILFTSSIAAIMPGPFEAVYAASKAFIQSFALALRNELSDSGISITALMPGPTDTNFFQRAGMTGTKVGREKKDDPALVAQQGFDALMAGEDHVIAGSMMNKFQGVAAKLLPDAVSASMHRKMIAPNYSS